MDIKAICCFTQSGTTAALVAREAGAIVTDFRGEEEIFTGRRVVAAAPGLHEELLRMIADGHADPGLDVLGPLPPLPLGLTGPLPTERT